MIDVAVDVPTRQPLNVFTALPSLHSFRGNCQQSEIFHTVFVNTFVIQMLANVHVLTVRLLLSLTLT